MKFPISLLRNCRVPESKRANNDIAPYAGKLKGAFDTRHLKRPITRVTIVRVLFNFTSLTIVDTSVETQNTLSRMTRTKETFSTLPNDLFFVVANDKRPWSEDLSTFAINQRYGFR